MTLFDDLITTEFKQYHKEMIDAVLISCSVPCRLIYSATRFNECANCYYDVIGGKSSNRYRSGGPIPFHHGVCPVCNGVGKIQNIETEDINLSPIWNSKDWYSIGLTQVSMADISVQTMSKMVTYPKLVRATSIVINTSIEAYGMPEFVRVGRPEPCGFGGDYFVITSWKRA
jgi:hypothetical protein